MLAEELVAGILHADTYDSFAFRASEIRDRVLSLLWGMKAEGLRIAGYGAPENGNTLLNFCGIGRFELDFLADPDPQKHEMFSPGMKIPIRPLDAIADEKPDVLLVLDRDLMRSGRVGGLPVESPGSRLLVPLPQPRLMQ
jgi:D-mycarose 3-C-methyltransferase